MFLVKNDKKYPFCYPGVSKKTENKPPSLYNLRFASRGQTGIDLPPCSIKLNVNFGAFFRAYYPMCVCYNPFLILIHLYTRGTHSLLQDKYGLITADVADFQAQGLFRIVLGADGPVP